jgi:hypothetical protein
MYEGMYTKLSARYSDAKMAESSAMPDILIFDRARAVQWRGVVPRPEDHRQGILLALALGSRAVGSARSDGPQVPHLAQVNADLALRCSAP